MKTREVCCCFILCVLLSCSLVGAIKTIKNIDQLRDTQFGKDFPHKGLVLLFWLAQNVQIEQNSQVLTFDPSTKDYGCRFLHNNTGFPSYGNMSRFYAIGDDEQSTQGGLGFPSYVTDHLLFLEDKSDSEDNPERLIIAVHRDMPLRMLNVYITLQHHKQAAYDPDRTYSVGPQLLQQIQELSELSGTDGFQTDEGYDTHPEEGVQPNQLMSLLVHQIDLGLRSKLLDAFVLFSRKDLAWFLTLAGCNVPDSYSSRNRPFGVKRYKRSDHCESQPFKGFQIKVQTAFSGGRAVITWSGVPTKYLKKGLQIALYEHKNSLSPLYKYDLKNESGDLLSDVGMTSGLQARVWLDQTSRIHGESCPELLYESPVLHEDNYNLSGKIGRYDASLQLYAKDGKAAARLYIKKSFTSWKEVFAYSWVGFYRAHYHSHDSYTTYGWCTKFTKNSAATFNGYDIHEYVSSLDIAPGVEARFMLEKSPDSHLATTQAWAD